MQSNRATKRFTIIIFILTALMTAFAFVHSAMPADVSGEESLNTASFLSSILSFFKLDVTLTDHIVRKSAHFTEYTAIGGLLLSCAYCFNRKKPQKYLPIVAFFGLTIPLLDETIQLNVEGRSGQISDVWLDFAGVCTGIVIMLVFYAIYRRIKKIN